MDAAKKARTIFRRTFTKTKNELESLLKESEDVDLVKIKALMEVLDQEMEHIKQRDTAVFNYLLEEENISDKDIDEEMDKQKEYAVAFQIIKKTVEQLLCEVESQSVSSQASSAQVGLGLSNGGQCSYKLPMLKLKEFGGELKDWLPFWSQFSKIDSDSSINCNDKMQYLIMATVSKILKLERSWRVTLPLEICTQR